jgi:phasin
LIVQRNISVALHQKSDYIILNRRLWRFQCQDDVTGLLITEARIGCGRRSVRCRIIALQRTDLMSEAIDTSVSKSRSKAAAQPAAFEMPKFELPNFEIPKMEIPAAFREIAEKSVSQAKETYEKMKSAAEEATDVLEDTYAAASKGASDYGLKVIEAARVNTNAAFDFATQLMTVKSLSEMVELSTAHTRKQFEALASQSKELAAIAQKVATDSAEPVKESFGKVFKKVA